MKIHVTVFCRLSAYLLAFNYFDQDRTGTITFEEFKAGAKIFGNQKQIERRKIPSDVLFVPTS